jgi:hypothetical protein
VLRLSWTVGLKKPDALVMGESIMRASYPNRSSMQALIKGRGKR